jgi:hypothetical protein
MKATYIFINPKGNDTGMTETFAYNEAGLLTDYGYHQHLMKNPPYQLRTVYRYQSEVAWTQMTYRNKTLTDSVVVRGAWANWYYWHSGILTEVHEYRGDSAREKVVRDGDTVVRPNRLANPSFDPFWDYYNAEKYAGKTVSRSVDSDTTRYLNDAGECLVMVINFYDNNFRPVKTNYYNFRIKRFDLFYLPYNERLNMIFFLYRSKKDKWSFEIVRKYNEKGWLIEESFIDAFPNKGGHGAPMMKKYEYTVY